MIFGENFLPKIPARWVLENATMTESQMNINPGGSATANITKEDAINIPEAMLLTIVAESYTNSYGPLDVIEIDIKTIDNDHIHFYCPISDTGNAIYSTILQATQVEYTSFTVAISSVSGITINDWSLSGPLEGDTATIINEIRGELPALLYDYNTARFDIGQQETTIALISAQILENTDLNGHIQITYNASEDATLIIRCKDNEVTELFTPILYDVKKGRGSIGIPHAYLEKFTGIHTFTVTAQVTSGSLFFDVRSILYTIDGGHLAQRIMDVGMDIRDIAMRRTSTESEPSRIYAIGIDDGQAMVRARPYSDVTETVWEPQSILGPAVEAAIEFDGQWSIRDKSVRFETDEIPWYFWIDLEGNLWAQQGNDVETKIQLDIDVTAVSVIKGWGLPEYYDQNQGLVVVYIKDGKVYYRSYTNFDSSTSWYWQPTIEVTEHTGIATSVRTFRTNDYRIGISIEDDMGETTVLITGRVWSGLAYGPERLHAKVFPPSIEFTEIERTKNDSVREHLTASVTPPSIDFLSSHTENHFIEARNVPITILNENNEEYEDWGYVVYARVQHKLTNLTAFPISDFVFTDSKNISYFVNSVETVDHQVLKFVMSDFNNAIGECTLSFIGGGTTKGGLDQDVDDFEISFTPINLVPSILPVPEVEVIWNE